MSRWSWEDPKWLNRWWGLAETAATWSKDPKRKVGACLVSLDMRQLSLGYNGPPKGFPDERLSQMSVEDKNMVMVHAELNALNNATFSKVGQVLFVTRHPCATCAGAIIAAGVHMLVCPPPAGEFSKWHKQHVMAYRLFTLAGKKIVNRTEDGRFVLMEFLPNETDPCSFT